MSHSILVVEDDAGLREALIDTLQLSGFDTVEASSAEEAVMLLKKQTFSIVVSDVQMGAMSGLDLLKTIKLNYPDLPVLMMTAYATIDDAVEAMRLGAIDYMAKPFAPEVLLNMVSRYMPAKEKETEGPVVADPQSLQLLELANKVAKSDASVMVLGPSGSGKEVLARFIHDKSDRKDEAFVAINCAAIPENMLEATLFGYEKGAFTGAITSRCGRFEMAEGGTLFLDEIGDLPLNMQVKLLRVLQERTYERVGGTKTLQTDVRIIAATHKNLEAMVAEETFREDLYYRLNVFPVEVPALRDRREDIPLLLNELISRMENEKRGSIRFNSAAIMSLCRHDWHGNVRELANLVERLAILHPYGVIGVPELPKKFRHVDEGDEDETRMQEPVMLPSEPGLVGLDTPALLPVNGIDLKDYLTNLERSLFQHALDYACGLVAREAY